MRLSQQQQRTKTLIVLFFVILAIFVTAPVLVDP
jgi:predicted nucleic acid-binding Zn ribbon protein